MIERAHDEHARDSAKARAVAGCQPGRSTSKVLELAGADADLVAFVTMDEGHIGPLRSSSRSGLDSATDLGKAEGQASHAASGFDETERVVYYCERFQRCPWHSRVAMTRDHQSGKSAPARKRAGARTRMPREEREQQLLDIAESLFTVHGVVATSIEDIARAAGVTRPMLYNHFGDLEGVLLACVQRARADFERQLVDVISALPDKSDLVSVLDAGGEAFFSLLQANPRRWALLFSNTTATSGRFSERMTDLRFGTTETIVGIARMVAPAADELRLHAAAHAISGAAEQLGRFWLREPDLSRARIVQYFREFTSGVALAVLADARATSTRHPRASSKKR